MIQIQLQINKRRNKRRNFTFSYFSKKIICIFENAISHLQGKFNVIF